MRSVAAFARRKRSSSLGFYQTGGAHQRIVTGNKYYDPHDPQLLRLISDHFSGLALHLLRLPAVRFSLALSDEPRFPDGWTHQAGWWCISPSRSPIGAVNPGVESPAAFIQRRFSFNMSADADFLDVLRKAGLASGDRFHPTADCRLRLLSPA